MRCSKWGYQHICFCIKRLVKESLFFFFPMNDLNHWKRAPRHIESKNLRDWTWPGPIHQYCFHSQRKICNASEKAVYHPIPLEISGSFFKSLVITGRFSSIFMHPLLLVTVAMGRGESMGQYIIWFSLVYND